MVERYVSLADADLSARHRAASPADRLIRTAYAIVTSSDFSECGKFCSPRRGRGAWRRTVA
jgi:hypothetical protein